MSAEAARGMIGTVLSAALRGADHTLIAGISKQHRASDTDTTLALSARAGRTMLPILAIADVDDVEQLLQSFSTKDVAKRREHGCKGS